MAGGFLVDGDGRRQALDGINIGFVHLAQKLAGVGGQTLHVTPLALSEDRVEGQELLPLPLTPVNTTNLLRGIVRSMLRRLC